MKSKISYDKHGGVCHLCINSDKHSDGRLLCCFLHREYLSSYHISKFTKYGTTQTIYCLDSATSMVESVSKRLGVKLSDLSPESLVNLNVHLSCPFYFSRRLFGRIFFTDNTKEWRDKYDLLKSYDAEPVILRNAIKTPDGTILESRFKHDYTSHEDKISKETYFTDGGFSYIRRSINKVPYIDFSIYSSDPIERIRLHFRWGTFGKDKSAIRTWVHLYKMSNDHLEAILQTQPLNDLTIRDVLEREKTYRKVHNIFIKD